MDGNAAIALFLVAIFGFANGQSPECDFIGVEVEVTEEKGVLTSPGYDTGKQLDNDMCLWLMKAPPGKFIEFKITDVSLTEDNLCKREFLQIQYEGSWEPYFKYCGKVSDVTIYAPTENDPRVSFTSWFTEESKGKGFRLEYRLVDEKPKCEPDCIACGQPFKCISSDKKCDGRPDCPGGEDEENCGHKGQKPSQCGVTKIPPDMDRIVGGREVAPGSWPWMVSVQSSFIWPSGHRCGGVLLNNLYVLTAAHCVVGNLFRVIRVKFADHNQFKNEGVEFTRNLATFSLHPQYNRATSLNDLAILKLSAPVEFNDIVSPICLPEKDEKLPECSSLYAVGWGRTEDKEGSDVLRQVVTTTISTDTCKNTVQKTLPPFTICTRAEGGGKNPCYGDSGGPLMKKKNGCWVTYGAVSWGPGICGEEATVYSQLSDSIDWIRETISK